MFLVIIWKKLEDFEKSKKKNFRTRNIPKCLTNFRPWKFLIKKHSLKNLKSKLQKVWKILAQKFFET